MPSGDIGSHRPYRNDPMAAGPPLGDLAGTQSRLALFRAYAHYLRRTGASPRREFCGPGRPRSQFYAMKIALPLTAANEFSTHYGAAAKFVVFDVDPGKRLVRRQVVIEPRDSEPCGWPPLLRAAGTDLVLAGGMGHGARMRMAEHGLKVLVGVTASAPEDLIAGWLAGTLVEGENACDGGGHGHSAHPHHHGHLHDHEHGCGCTH